MLSRIQYLCWSLALFGLSACSEPPSRVVVSERRVSSVAPKPAIPGATSDQRFGRAGGTPDDSNGPPIEWDHPEGWVAVAASQFRTANFRVAKETECYITLLPGDAGGFLANVNRWRKQMGLGPTTAGEIEAGPRIDLLGQSAPFIALEGNFTGMGSEAQAGWAMYGALFGAPGGTLFVKMVGPDAEVKAERDRFVHFCASIRPVGAPRRSLTWTAPETWKDEGPRSMREVSYSIGEANEGECYISILGGGAGGVVANINRWRDQVGLDSLSPKEIGELPQLDVLGGKATLFEAAGAFKGMGGDEAEEGHAILGVIRELDSRVLFVKMVGPAELVEGERERFVAFCTSLREEG